MKFVNFANNWLNQKRCEVKTITLNSYQILIENHVIPFLGNYEIQDINDEILNEFYTYLANLGLAKSTVELIKKVVKSMLYLQKRKKGEKTEKNTVEPFLNEEQLKEFVSYLNKNNSRRTNIILFAVLTGINLGELCGIKGKDINFADNTINISTTVNRVKMCSKDETEKTKLIQTETRHSRNIKVADSVMELLKNNPTKENSFLVTGKKALPEKRTLQKELVRISKILNVHITFKILQSTFIVNCIENGATLAQIAEYIGTTAENLAKRGYPEEHNVKEILKFQEICIG